MRSWLEQEPAVSHNLRRTIKGSVDDCEVVLDDLEEHVSSVLRSTRAGNKGSTLGSLGFGRKLKHIWNANTIAKHETRLNSQVQTVMHLINFVKLNNTDQQDSAVDTAETRTIISKSATDANMIRSLRDGSTIRENRTVYTNVGDHDKQLEVDEVLIRSPAYIAQYRALMRGDPSSSKPGSTSTLKPPDGVGDSSKASSLAIPEERSRRSGNSFFKSLTWSLSPESRTLASLLCQAAIAGDIKWMESLLDEGAYVNGCAIDDDEKARREYSPPQNASSPTPPTGRRTPLILAAMNKRNEAFHFLLDRGAYLEAKDPKGYDVWHYLVEYDPNFCIRLIKSSINPPADSLWCLLRQAIDAERVDVLKSLLKRATRRHANAACKIWSGIECKMENGIPDSVTDATILWKAMEKKNLDIVKLLIDKGAGTDERIRFLQVQGWELGDRSLDFLGRTSNPGPTPLFSVVGDTARLDFVKYLVSMGASIFAKTDCRVEPSADWGNRDDVTPLHVARGPCADFLVGKGAKVFAMDRQGQTPLFWAIGFWPEPDPEAVLANLTQDSPTNIVDKKGISPLVMLAQRLSYMNWVSEKTLDNYRTIADALVDAGAVLPQRDPTPTFDGHSIYSRLIARKKFVVDSCRTGWIHDSKNKTKVKGLCLGYVYWDGSIRDSCLLDEQFVPLTKYGTPISGPFELGNVSNRITTLYLDLCNLLVPESAR